MERLVVDVPEEPSPKRLLSSNTLRNYIVGFRDLLFDVFVVSSSTEVKAYELSKDDVVALKEYVKACLDLEVSQVVFGNRNVRNILLERVFELYTEKVAKIIVKIGFEAVGKYPTSKEIEGVLRNSIVV